jgi:hypothetical protein
MKLQRLSGEQWNRVQEIFLAAVELPPLRAGRRGSALSSRTCAMTAAGPGVEGVAPECRRCG